MLQVTSIRQIPLRDAEGRQTHYMMQPGNWAMTDPFLLWADVRYPHGYFADHPHKGIQTATYVLDGAITHYDNFSGSGRLEKDDFQIMTAGSGIIHNEDPDVGTTARVLQLWINLSAENKKLQANYIDVLKNDTPEITLDGATVQVLAGQYEAVPGVDNFTPVNIYQGTVTNTLNIPIQQGFNSYLYLLEGDGTVSGEKMAAYDLAHIVETTEEGFIQLTANSPIRYFFISGKPIKEPVAAGGPFVMNTYEELQEAFEAYEAGTFIKNTK